MARHKMSLLAILVVLLAILAIGSMAILKFQTMAPHKHSATYPAGSCVVAREPETDGEPVICLNTGKIATEADYSHICFTDGRGIELYSVTRESFITIACGVAIPSLPDYAAHWNSVVYTGDGNSVDNAAWSGNDFVIASSYNGAHAGYGPEVVGMLASIQADIWAAYQEGNSPLVVGQHR